MSYTKTTYYNVPNYWRITRAYRATPTPVYYAGAAGNFAINGSKSGMKMENYKEKIRRGENASTAFDCDLHKISSETQGTATCYGRELPAPGYNPSWIRFNFVGNHTANKDGVLPHLGASLLQANAVALSKTYKKLDSELTHLNSPAVIAEFLDVVRQFGKPFESIVDLTNRRLNRLELERRGLKGSTTFKRIKYAEIIASTYLEYAFGLAPLISDTEKAAEALARFHYERDNKVHWRKRIVCRGLDEVSKSTVSILNQYPFTVQLNAKTVTQATVQYVCGLDASVTPDLQSNDRLKSLLGFRPEKWIPAIWEAVPWSWLVDYFSNVQQILDSCSTNTSRVAWICKTERQCTTLSVKTKLDVEASRLNLWGLGYRSGQEVSGDFGSLEKIRTTVHRTIPSSLGVVPLALEVPTQVKQLANMAAVLISRRPSSSALWLT